MLNDFVFWFCHNTILLKLSPALPTSMATVRQIVAVRFLIRKFWQRMFGMDRENGVWVEFYSTLFVFLTDTFTSKVLCGFYLRRRHYICNEVSGFLNLFKKNFKTKKTDIILQIILLCQNCISVRTNRSRDTVTIWNIWWRSGAPGKIRTPDP